MKFRSRCYVRPMMPPVRWLALLMMTLIIVGCAGRRTRLSYAQSPGALGFTAALYDELRQERGNLFFSPASLRVTLALATGGARGKTAQQLRAALRLADGDAAHAAMAGSLERWSAIGNGGQIQLRVANRLWAHRDLTLAPQFVALARDQYHAPVAQLDFADGEGSRNVINHWVGEQTSHMIDELINPGALNRLTRLVLTNAVFFKAKWQNEFEASLTKPAPFLGAARGTQAQLMHQEARLLYRELDGGQLLELPYGNGDVVLDVLLPSDPKGLRALEDQLVAGALQGWLASLDQRLVDVYLPKFHASWGAQLADTFAAMGAPLAFSRAADFSGIAAADRSPLCISEVAHQAVIDVDEEGTTAAAATAVIVAMPSASLEREEKPIVFRADHPFVYLIRAKSSDEILFLGRLVDPAAR